MYPPFCDELRFDRGCKCVMCKAREAAIIAFHSSNTPTPMIPPPPIGPWPGGFGGWSVVPPLMPVDWKDILETKTAPVLPPESDKLPPMSCIKCYFRNEFVGPEHLDKDGKYTCRQCKKR